MPVYTVHAPAPFTATDRFVFVRDGFHVWAFLAGPVWLLFHRLWLALLGYLVLSFAGEVALSSLGIGTGPRLLIMLMVAVLMGVEGASLRRWSLSWGKWRQLGVVVADNQDSAERRFFDRWALRSDTPFSERGGPPPIRRTTRPPSASDDAIIGLFPQPGGPR